jgi:hypothetical protein
MGNFLAFDLNVHRTTFVGLCEEYFSWMASELQRNYNIDVPSMLGITLREYVENAVDEFASSSTCLAICGKKNIRVSILP